MTDGNPFLVYEAARLLGNRPGAALPPRPGRWWRARLDALAPDLRSLLVAAAVVGREFSLGVLSRVVDRPPDDLLDSLTQAEKLVVLEEVELGRWSFSHALLRDALLNELDDDGRQVLHRRAGEVLHVSQGTDPASVPEIAHHLAEGRAPGASDMCARAGETALAGYAFEDAARWFRRAIDLLPDGQERRRYDLFLALGAALLSAGNEPDAREAHRMAIRAARALGSTELAAEAAVRVAPISVSDAAVIGALDDALCDLPEEDSALRARVLVSFAAVMRASSVSRVVLRQVSAQGRDMARRVGDARRYGPCSGSGASTPPARRTPLTSAWRSSGSWWPWRRPAATVAGCSWPTRRRRRRSSKPVVSLRRGSRPRGASRGRPCIAPSPLDPRGARSAVRRCACRRPPRRRRAPVRPGVGGSVGTAKARTAR